jgi:tRNA threonylcarbamoyladenosine biosynthesis protein TsaE
MLARMAEVLELALPTRRATQRLGAALGAALLAGDLVVLEGDLGAGKTFLVRAIARALGVPSAVPVTSPTFALVHELGGRLPIVHADLYRLDAADELVELGLRDRIGGDAVVLVEWGARFVEALGVPDVRIDLALGAGGEERSARVVGQGERGGEVVRAVRLGMEPVKKVAP